MFERVYSQKRWIGVKSRGGGPEIEIAVRKIYDEVAQI